MGGGPTSLWGGTASPAPAGTVTPIEDAAVTGGCSMVPHPLAPTPAWPALHRGVPQFPHLAVLPPSSSGMPGQTDATLVGARRVSGAAQAPAGVEAPILSPGRSGRTGLEPGWGSGTALASQPRGGTPGELLAQSCPAKSRRDHEFVGRRLGPWRSAEHHTGDAAPPALVSRQPLCLAGVHQRARPQRLVSNAFPASGWGWGGVMFGLMAGEKLGGTGRCLGGAGLCQGDVGQ